MKQITVTASKWLVFTILALSLAACDTLNVVQTAEDGQEVRFDTLKGSIEYTEAMIIGIARDTKKALDNGIMSKDTAIKIQGILSDSQTSIEAAQILVTEMKFDEAETQVAASRAVLNIARKLIKTANIGDTQL